MPTTELTTPRVQQGSKALHIGLWVAQALLAAAFLMAGAVKLITPWTPENPIPELLVRFIGVAEIAGAIGLLAPSLTRIKPWLTPTAAAALVVVMVLATGFHAMRGEPLVATIVLSALAAFVAWGRLRGAPIPAR